MKKHLLIIATLLLGLTAAFTSCSNSSQEADNKEQAEEISKPKGEDYNLEALEKGSLYKRIDSTSTTPNVHYVRFNPSMIFFMYAEAKSGIEMNEMAAQYYVKHDAPNHQLTIDHCVFKHQASDEFVNQFLNKTITIEKEGDKITINGTNTDFDGSYTWIGDDDNLPE